METYSMCYSYTVSDLMTRSGGRKESVSTIQNVTCDGSSNMSRTNSFIRNNLSRNSVNNILRKIPRNGKEKLKRKESLPKEIMKISKEVISPTETNGYTETNLKVPHINQSELRSMRNYPTYTVGRGTQMTSKLWNLTRVTVRSVTENKNEKGSGILEAELANLCKITHPHILLLMGVCPAEEEKGNNLQLVFEHVHLGSLYFWVHKQEKVPSLRNSADIIIQITEALVFLHNLGYLHCAITSHAVQLVSPNLAKLGQLEYTMMEEEGEVGGGRLAAHTRQLLTDTGWHCLFNWLSPEVISGSSVSRLADIYSLTCIIYELCTGTVPWSELSAERIAVVALSSGCALPLDSQSLPTEIFQLLDKGLQSCPTQRDLDLHEIRDVFGKMKRNKDKERKDDGHHKTKRHKNQLPSKPCATRSLSSSAIQYNHQRILRKFTYNVDQRNPMHSSSDFSFVSNVAKRNFLRSQPSSPTRQIGLGPRTKTSLFYDAFSLSSGLDFSGSSGESRDGETSDSSSSSLSPTSGYSSYELLETQEKPTFFGVGEINNHHKHLLENKRSKSVPTAKLIKNPQPYQTGIKPASHRTESRISSTGVRSGSIPNTANNSNTSTPKHSMVSSHSSSSARTVTSSSSKIKDSNHPKPYKQHQASSPNHFLSSIKNQSSRKYSSTNCFIETLKTDEVEAYENRIRVWKKPIQETSLSQKKSLCQSHPRLFAKASMESGYSSASPIMGLTGNMQLSNRYKSSADIVSELLQRPLPSKIVERNAKHQIDTARHKRTTGSVDETGRYSSVKSDNNIKENLKKSIFDSKKYLDLAADLKSIELVRNASSSCSERKVGRDERTNLPLQELEKHTTRIMSPSAMVARIQSVNSEVKIIGDTPNGVTGNHVTKQSKQLLEDSYSSPVDFGGQGTGSEVEAGTKPIMDKKQVPTNQHPVQHGRSCCSRKHTRFSQTPSISSRPSMCGSSLGAETEDFYLDDELRPGLELDPNMRLLHCGESDGGACCCHLDGDFCTSSARLFDGADNESILSMEMPSTGPPSLSIVSTASFAMSEYDGGRADVGTKYSSVLAWGVEQACTDISSSEGEEETKLLGSHQK